MQLKNVQKFLLTSDHESSKVITVQRVYNLCTAIDYWLLDRKLERSDGVNIFKR